MVRIAPVRLSFNPKTLWFDAGDMALSTGDAVVVATARGDEFGCVSDTLFEMDYEDTKKLNSPLKPVKRLATDEDIARDEECTRLAREALPTFKRMASESVPDMNPIAVEYLFDSDKAVFYFDAEERVDFRDLVRRLASEFHVRVDMKQIGVRDGARMVGGLGHCGQELCCRRLGGEFNPVSIRMAKEQDLSLNPQKISGLCGRLMCCLRYEFDAYKDFHGRAPKKNARVSTPDGEGKVVDLDVPREVVSIKVGDEKPVKVPLAGMEAPEEGARPNAVSEEAWERANAPVVSPFDSGIALFTNELSGEDKLAEPGKVHHVHKDDQSPKASRSRRRRGGSATAKDAEAQEESTQQRKSRRRRSTTVKSDGSTEVANQGKQRSRDADAKQEDGQKSKSSSTRRRRNRTSPSKQQAKPAGEKQVQGSKVGRNSSALRSNKAKDETQESAAPKRQSGTQRRRRRSHKANSSGEGKAEE